MSNLIDVCRSYKGQSHQDAALLALQDKLPQGAWDIFLRDWRKEEPKPQGIVTPELMHRLTGYRASAFDQHFCDSFNAMLAATGFNQHPEATKMLMANLMTESGNFVWMKEIAYGNAYENRSDLGNSVPGDGHRFRGCGPLQVTGRSHFTAFHDWLKRTRGIDDPRILSEGTDYVADAYPFEIAIDWIERNHLLDACINQGFYACCRRINGGTNGWASRHQNYQICQKVMA